MNVPATIRVVSSPVHPDSDRDARQAVDELFAAYRAEHDRVISDLVTEAVPLHDRAMLGALHIDKIAPDAVEVDPGPARAADRVVLRLEGPSPSLASFWPWWPGRGRARIETLSEFVA